MESIINDLLDNVSRLYLDVNSLLATLYNSIDAIKSMTYYKNTILFDSTNNYITTNTLKVLACISKRHKTSTQEYYDRSYDARWFEYNPFLFRYNNIRDKELWNKIICKIIMINMNSVDLKSYVIKDLRYLCNIDQVKTVLSHIDKQDSKNVLILFNDHASDPNMMRYMKRLMSYNVTDNCIVFFDGTKLDYDINTLILQYIESITCSLTNKTICKEFIELILQLGYNIASDFIELMITSCIHHKLDYNVMEPIFDTGYRNINICIPTDSAIDHVRGINDFVCHLCIKYRLNITRCDIMKRTSRVPWMAFEVDTDRFDTVITFNTEYIDNERYIKELLHGMIYTSNIKMLIHYITRYDKRLEQCHIEKIIKYWNVMKIQEIIPHLYLGNMFDRNVDYIGTIVSYHGNDDMVCTIMLSFIREYQRHYELSNDVIKRCITNYIKMVSSSLITFSNGLPSYKCGKNIFTKILDMFVTIIDDTDFIEHDLLMYCINRSSTSFYYKVCKFVISNGFPVNALFHDNMTLFEYYVTTVRDRVHYNKLIKLFIKHGGIVTQRIMIAARNKNYEYDIMTMLRDCMTKTSSCVDANSALTVKELRERVKQLGIKGYSKLRKDQLVALLNKHDTQ